MRFTRRLRRLSGFVAAAVATGVTATLLSVAAAPPAAAQVHTQHFTFSQTSNGVGFTAEVEAGLNYQTQAITIKRWRTKAGVASGRNTITMEVPNTPDGSSPARQQTQASISANTWSSWQTIEVTRNPTTESLTGPAYELFLNFGYLPANSSPYAEPEMLTSFTISTPYGATPSAAAEIASFSCQYAGSKTVTVEMSIYDKGRFAGVGHVRVKSSHTVSTNNYLILGQEAFGQQVLGLTTHPTTTAVGAWSGWHPVSYVLDSASTSFAFQIGGAPANCQVHGALTFEPTVPFSGFSGNLPTVPADFPPGVRVHDSGNTVPVLTAGAATAYTWSDAAGSLVEWNSAAVANRTESIKPVFLKSTCPAVLRGVLEAALVNNFDIDHGEKFNRRVIQEIQEHYTALGFAFHIEWVAGDVAPRVYAADATAAANSVWSGMAACGLHANYGMQPNTDELVALEGMLAGDLGYEGGIQADVREALTVAYSYERGAAVVTVDEDQPFTTAQWVALRDAAAAPGMTNIIEIDTVDTLAQGQPPVEDGDFQLAASDNANIQFVPDGTADGTVCAVDDLSTRVSLFTYRINRVSQCEYAAPAGVTVGGALNYCTLGWPVESVDPSTIGRPGFISTPGCDFREQGAFVGVIDQAILVGPNYFYQPMLPSASGDFPAVPEYGVIGLPSSTTYRLRGGSVLWRGPDETLSFLDVVNSRTRPIPGELACVTPAHLRSECGRALETTSVIQVNPGDQVIRYVDGFQIAVVNPTSLTDGWNLDVDQNRKDFIRLAQGAPAFGLGSATGASKVAVGTVTSVVAAARDYGNGNPSDNQVVGQWLPFFEPLASLDSSGWLINLSGFGFPPEINPPDYSPVVGTSSTPNLIPRGGANQHFVGPSHSASATLWWDLLDNWPMKVVRALSRNPAHTGSNVHYVYTVHYGLTVDAAPQWSPSSGFAPPGSYLIQTVCNTWINQNGNRNTTDVPLASRSFTVPENHRVVIDESQDVVSPVRCINIKSTVTATIPRSDGNVDTATFVTYGSL